MKKFNWQLLFFCSLILLTPWFWRLLLANQTITFFVCLVSVLLFYFNRFKKGQLLLLVCFFLLLGMQLVGVERRDLLSLDNDQQRVQQMRLGEYPPIRIGQVWIPLAHWLEGRSETILFYRIKQNVFELIDPNLYFFANHPRERAGMDEFEKLPFFFFPLFVFGFLSELGKKGLGYYFLFLILPVLLLSVWGNIGRLGPFCLFPFLMISIFDGCWFLAKKICSRA
ncbi:MAG: hypothetical protein ABID04_00420 [Patescibacteria group bacterium]